MKAASAPQRNSPTSRSIETSWPEQIPGEQPAKGTTQAGDACATGWQMEFDNSHRTDQTKALLIHGRNARREKSGGTQQRTRGHRGVGAIEVRLLEAGPDPTR